MATGTNRRDDQATAEQALAVHTFGIVFQDLVLRDVVSKLDGSAFVMAAAAQKGDLSGRGGRTGIGRPQDVVSSVTIRAARGQRVTAPRRLPVQAFGMLLCFIDVARAAVNRLELFGMGELLSCQISVATCALKCRVRRGPQGSLVEGGWHSRLPLACAGAGCVAAHARLASRQGLGLLGLQGHGKEDSSGEASGADSDQKTLLAYETHTIIPKPRAFMVEFHSTSYDQQRRQ
jgi:hypothetical protein